MGHRFSGLWAFDPGFGWQMRRSSVKRTVASEKSEDKLDGIYAILG